MNRRIAMSERNFRDLLEGSWSDGKSVCVGLDSELAKIPKGIHFCHSYDFRDSFSGMKAGITITGFNQKIVEATADLSGDYKLNTAFYEACGPEGISALRDTIDHIHACAPKVPVILDAKRADIGNTNNGYAQFAFDYLRADAITVHPYLGGEALRPFLERKDKGVIVLCRTSNPGAGEFQDRIVSVDCTWDLYRYVALQVKRDWNKNGNCAVVVGATFPEELKKVRDIVEDLPILIPGVGFQQKDVPLEEQVKQVVANGQDSRGQGMIINSSRGIIFASNGPDFAEAARRETQKLHDLINSCQQS
jgi:orotidine-5'-phosphate decarboxylase